MVVVVVQCSRRPLHLKVLLLLLLNRFLRRGSADRWAGEKCPSVVAQVVGHDLSLLSSLKLLIKQENPPCLEQKNSS